MFLDLVTRGSLRQLGADMRSVLKLAGVDKEKLLRTLAKQLLEAVDGLHKHGMFHMDIKEDNVLFSKNGILQLFDLGMLVTKDEGINGCTPELLPPEAELAQDQSTALKSEADKWTLGLILKEFALPLGKNSELYKIVEKDLLRRAAGRTSPEQILGYGYFKQDVYSDKELVEMFNKAGVRGSSR